MSGTLCFEKFSVERTINIVLHRVNRKRQSFSVLRKCSKINASLASIPISLKYRNVICNKFNINERVLR